MNKTINTAIIGLIVCALVVYTEYHNWYFAEFMNKFFPCQQNPMNSFPCHRVYSLYFMAVASVLGIVFFGILLFTGYKYIRSK